MAEGVVLSCDGASTIGAALRSYDIDLRHPDASKRLNEVIAYAEQGQKPQPLHLLAPHYALLKSPAYLGNFLGVAPNRLSLPLPQYLKEIVDQAKKRKFIPTPKEWPVGTKWPSARQANAKAMGQATALPGGWPKHDGAVCPGHFVRHIVFKKFEPCSGRHHSRREGEQCVKERGVVAGTTYYQRGKMDSQERNDAAAIRWMDEKGVIHEIGY